MAAMPLSRMALIWPISTIMLTTSAYIAMVAPVRNRREVG
jgi:hypothetical protein